MKKNNKIKIENLDIFLSFLLLGFTSFGGPIAHIGYFRNFFVKQKKWLDEKLYADFVSLCNFLPGPSSSQVGISIGYYFKGVKGAILAWVGFTMPSVIILMLFGYAILNYDNSIPQGVLKGLKAIVVIIVFQAILGMSKNLLKDPSIMLTFPLYSKSLVIDVETVKSPSINMLMSSVSTIIELSRSIKELDISIIS